MNKQSSVVESLFYSYFIEGIDIGNMEQLIIIAKQHNIYDDKTLIFRGWSFGKELSTGLR